MRLDITVKLASTKEKARILVSCGFVIYTEVNLIHIVQSGPHPSYITEVVLLLTFLNFNKCIKEIITTNLW